MYLTYKAKITTDKKTDELLENLCFSATKLYNTINYYLRSEWAQSRAEYEMNRTQYKNWEHHFGYDCLPYEKPKIPLNRIELQRMFKDNHWACYMHSQSAQFIVGEVLSAYRSWFALRKNGSLKANPPSFRPKTSLSTVTFVQKASYIFSKKGFSYLRLSLGTKRTDGLKEIILKITHRKYLPDFSLLRNVRITYDTASGTYYAHLVFDVPSEEANEPSKDNVVAIDLGLNNIITATFSDGTSQIISGRELKAIRRYWQKVRAKVKPPSVTKRKPSRRYLQICRKEARQIAHRLHIISKQFLQLCEDKGVTHIVFGDLTGIRENIDYSKKANQQLHSWSFSKIVALVSYKAERIGIFVETINEDYTSQCCSMHLSADKINKKHAVPSNRKHRGLYVCNECKKKINADRNGASNILKRYLRNRSSGSVALPVVTLALLRTDAHCLRIYCKHSVVL
jgi:IS605 OrfB family transposase